MKSRYKLSPWYVRAFRWWTNKPVAVLTFLSYVVPWALRGARIPTIEERYFKNRREHIRHCWVMCMSVADFEMGAYVTLDELIAELKSRGH